ncbi:MAG: ribonuclease H-like domain-containing protein [Ardenticatenales bacterium]|nr:ribonuclease H-like domain-containing protein [Ardenticatenales bacterium]
MTTAPPLDPYVFGWDPTPGIVSVWADRDGRALVWRREGGRVVRERDRYRPWMFATTLADLAHLGPALTMDGASGGKGDDAGSGDDAASAGIGSAGMGSAGIGSPSGATITYRELDGSPTDYRFVISAPTARMLERAIQAGATRRLGSGAADLRRRDAYHRVGPVEQYLMRTGRTYFRGLVYDDLHRLQFDLETTSLDPQRGRIFLAAVRDSRGLAATIEAPQPDDERRLIAELCRVVRERDPDVIENHNLFGFDLPFLEARAAHLGVPLLLGREGAPPLLGRHPEPPPDARRRRRTVRYTVAGRELIDTLEAVRRHDFVARDLPGHGLKDVARHFGIAAPERTYVAGAEVYRTYLEQPDIVRRYALDDVAEVDGLSRRLLGAPFALAGMAPRRYEQLASAGPAMGILEPMLVRAYLHAGAALPYGAARGEEDLEGHAGGAVHLFATGVAEHVVKVDIASMYPSLMRAYKIGPACDSLGALLHIVSQLTTLRLGHKDALRTAPPGSLERGHHDAMQAAMKLLINSAYGYMAAGSMALFADRRAADEVTRRGREVLSQVVEALRARGMALLEADTDGVFFAAPLDWTEARERALVADVASELPDGIRLEYEGRYRAMLSHEVKNYALLSYDGTLIVRGVALRSSRSEPFGERFLRRALGATLIGDVPALQRAFRETVQALTERSLPAADVATRVRLTKTPEAYLAARGEHREAAYEALLAAGRDDWAPGERVRCYRANGKGYVWLPDETDEPRGHDGSESGQDDRRSDRADERRDNRPNSRHDDRRDYDVDHYVRTLVTSYAGRLRKAFAPEDFAQLFRTDRQGGLFDRPVEQIAPLWVRCAGEVEGAP